MVAQPKQVVPSNSSRTAHKLILVSEQMRYTQSLQGVCPPKLNVWDMFKSLIVHVADRQYSNRNLDNEQLKNLRVTKCRLEQSIKSRNWKAEIWLRYKIGFDSLRYVKGLKIEHLRYETGNQIQSKTHRSRELNSKS